MELSGKGLLHFHQQASSLIGSQTILRTNMFRLINPTLAMSQTILKDFKNAPPAEMLIYVENWIFSLCE